MSKRLILCDCAGSQSIDARLISDQCAVSCSRVHTALCSTEIAQAAKEMQDQEVVIACLQEHALFEELAKEIDAPSPAFLDLRDRAGWSDDGATAGPKMAALITDALLEHPPIKMADIQSDGRCLIIGAADIALDAATQLADILSVTVLLSQPPELLGSRRFDVVSGQLKTVTGTLGAFSVKIDALRQLQPGGRGGFSMGPPRSGGRTECDVILDLSGGTALFTAPHARDGYLRVDPRDRGAVAKAVFNASQLIGSFEKPFYVANNTHLCAHSRAEIIGCSACIDNCSSAAITPDGEHVKIDPLICDGCGDCVALCPSGALEFDAPPTSFLFKRIQSLADSFSGAGGGAPKLLVVDQDFGSEMISLAARFGRGLPGDVIPLELESTTVFGHAEMLAALACGFARVDILLAPKQTATTLRSQAELACAIAPSGSDVPPLVPPVRLLELGDPDALSEALYGTPSQPITSEPILAQGGRRQITRVAAKALNSTQTDPIPLPAGAPYGQVKIDTDACTLCLSCVSLCPAGALADNPDMPQLRFTEDACLQCGLCTRLCPEKALTLEPRLDLSDAALTPKVLHEEEPFACISCGGLFGVKSTVEKITSLLAGKHSMFATSEAGKLIQMCDDCRVKAQNHSENAPFQAADRPQVITTDDYFSKRKDH